MIRKMTRPRRSVRNLKRSYKSKGLKVRGGFTPPLKPRSLPKNWKVARKPSNLKINNWSAARAFAAGQLGRMGWRLTEAAFNRYGPRLAAYAEGKIQEGISRAGRKAKSILPNESQPFNRKTGIPYFEYGSVSNMQKSNLAAFASKKYTTNINVGYRKSKSLAQAASLYGVHKVEKFNTLASYKSTPTLQGEDVNRANTQATYGFNQKCFVFLNALWSTNVSDISLEFRINESLSPYKTSGVSTERVYGLIDHASTQIKLSNSNQYYPVKVKVHQISIDDDTAFPGTSLASRVFNATADTQQDGRIPKRYQFSNTTALNQYTKVLCSRRVNLNMSAYFRNTARIVSTTSKRLNPGDIWNFNVTETFGPGVDIEKCTFMNNASPLYHTYVLELSGVECEGVQQEVIEAPLTAVQNQTNILGTYIGTSPGEINFEGRRSVTFVSNPNPEFPSQEGPNNGMTFTAAVKAYSEKPEIPKEFNTNHELIGLPGQLGKELFIPVITDKDLRFSQSATATDTGTEGLVTTNQLLAQLRDILDPPTDNSGFQNTYDASAFIEDEFEPEEEVKDDSDDFES